MSHALLAEWIAALEPRGGRSVWVGEDGVFCLDPGEGAVIAIEWDADAHGVHLYAHPGHAVAPGGERAVDGDGDEEGPEDEGASAAAPRQAVCIDLSEDPDGPGQSRLHVAPDTGLVSLSLQVPMAALSPSAFDALVAAFIEDVELWALVFGGDGSPSAG